MSSPKLPPLTDPPQIRAKVEAQLNTAIDQAKNPWHWPVLVTDLGGRVVVLRAYDRDAHTWQFYTDRRAEKVAQLAARPVAEAVFYDGDLRWQLRLRGRAEELLEDGFRQNLWRDLAPAARANYATVHPPGTTLLAIGQGLSPGWPEDERTQAAALLNFAVFTFHIEHYDFLQLHREGALRCRWDVPNEDFHWLVP